jgi:hypothetical protein
MHVKTLTVASLLLTVTACPPAGSNSDAPIQKPTAGCTKMGQNCEYSPGKIGLCTVKAGECDGGACFSCMSLH